MKRGLWTGLAVAALAAFGLTSEAGATMGMARGPAATGAGQSIVTVAHRRKPQVRGFVRRGGYYSYHAEDSINTYGNSRTLYGSADVYRNPTLDQQTRLGPFDHGFFYDSGISTPYGGSSPYMH
jgi:hypothetical protein